MLGLDVIIGANCKGFSMIGLIPWKSCGIKSISFFFSLKKKISERCKYLVEPAKKKSTVAKVIKQLISKREVKRQMVNIFSLCCSHGKYIRLNGFRRHSDFEADHWYWPFCFHCLC